MASRVALCAMSSVRSGFEWLDVNIAILAIVLSNRCRKALADVERDLDAGLAGEDLEGTDFALRDPAASAQERDQPLGICVLRSTDVDREPHQRVRVAWPLWCS